MTLCLQIEPVPNIYARTGNLPGIWGDDDAPGHRLRICGRTPGHSCGNRDGRDGVGCFDRLLIPPFVALVVSLLFFVGAVMVIVWA